MQPLIPFLKPLFSALPVDEQEPLLLRLQKVQSLIYLPLGLGNKWFIKHVIYLRLGLSIG